MSEIKTLEAPNLPTDYWNTLEIMQSMFEDVSRINRAQELDEDNPQVQLV